MNYYNENEKIKFSLDDIERVKTLANSLYCDAVEYKRSIKEESSIYDIENKSIRNRSMRLSLKFLCDIIKD